MPIEIHAAPVLAFTQVSRTGPLFHPRTRNHLRPPGAQEDTVAKNPDNTKTNKIEPDDKKTKKKDEI
jgi:hypothetical protein